MIVAALYSSILDPTMTRLIYVIFLFICGLSLSVHAHTIDDDQLWYERKKAAHELGAFPAGTLHVIQLKPNEDLINSIWRYARVTKIKAASIVSTVGSLRQTNIRYSNNSQGTVATDSVEIVSLVGNVDFQKDVLHETAYSNSGGDGHLHISVSNENGTTTGGHLLPGNLVYTTAEITLLEVKGALFDREIDTGFDGSGYRELKIYEVEREG